MWWPTTKTGLGVFDLSNDEPGKLFRIFEGELPANRTGPPAGLRERSIRACPCPGAMVRKQVRYCVRGVISPLSADLYMRPLVLGWKKLELEKSLGTRIVTYADDLVILCRKGRAEEALQQMRDLMGKLKLTVNEEKTRICKVPEGASTSWATRSGGGTRRRPARPVWAYGRRRRASGA